MSSAPLTVINPLRVSQGDVLHDPRKGGLTSLHDEVDVVGHQTEGMHAAFELFDRVLKEEVKTTAVSIGEEHVIAGITTQDDVIDGARIVNAMLAGHERRYQQMSTRQA
jgi:hypothetical protein